MTSADWIRALYAPEERAAVVLIPRDAGPGRDGSPPKVEQRVFDASTAASPKVQAWLRHMNARRYDVFVGMQPMREKVRTRHKGDVARVDRVYLDIDEAGPAALERILGDARRGRIPEPRFALATSPDRCQVVWSTPPGALDPPRAESLMRGLVAEYGGDRAATDVSRVLRCPGFKNWKRDGVEVHVVHHAAAALARPEAFPAPLFAARPQAPAPRTGSYAPAAAGGGSGGGGGRGDRSRSGDDWRHVHAQLRAGRDPAAIAAELEQARQDKGNPRYYAERTVRRAIESLDRPSAGPSR